jgi:hypothetical protein
MGLVSTGPFVMLSRALLPVSETISLGLCEELTSAETAETTALHAVSHL